MLDEREEPSDSVRLVFPRKGDERDFTLLVLLFVSFRLMTTLLYQPGGVFLDYRDYSFYFAMAEQSARGYLPYLHFWMEYPPLFPWIAVVFYHLAIHLPSLNTPLSTFHALLTSFTLLFETGNLILLYRLGRLLYGPTTAFRCAFIYAGLFIPFQTWLGWFDSIPVFCLLLGLWLVLRGHPGLAGVAAGVGFLVKVFPILLVPVALRTLTKGRLRLLLGAAVSSAVLAAPFFIANPSIFVASYASLLQRSSWETVWALLDGYYGYGVVAPLTRRFDPATAFWRNHPEAGPWIVAQLAIVAVYLALWKRGPARPGGRDTLVLLTVTLTFFLLASKGYSPQYLTWLIPFVVLLTPNLVGVVGLLVASVANIVEFPFYFLVLTEQRGVLVGTIAVRTALLVALAVVATRLWLGKPWPAVQVPRRVLAAVGASLVAVVLVLGTHVVGRYYHDAFQRLPQNSGIAFLMERALPGDAVVFATPELFYRFVPFLKGPTAYLIDDIALEQLGTAGVEEYLRRIQVAHGAVWVVLPRGPASGEVTGVLESWLRRNGMSDASFKDGVVSVSRYHPTGDARAAGRELLFSGVAPW
ncbi:MAG TPA: glycosyltransferase 87 family protein [Chloroflexota bacterium]